MIHSFYVTHRRRLKLGEMEASVHTFTTVYHVGLYVQSSVVITVSVHRDESSETYFLNERYHSGAAFLVNK